MEPDPANVREKPQRLAFGHAKENAILNAWAEPEAFIVLSFATVGPFVAVATHLPSGAPWNIPGAGLLLAAALAGALLGHASRVRDCTHRPKRTIRIEIQLL